MRCFSFLYPGSRYCKGAPGHSKFFRAYNILSGCTSWRSGIRSFSTCAPQLTFSGCRDRFVRTGHFRWRAPAIQSFEQERVLFEVDRENNQIRVERSFRAPLDLVWAAWTEADILDQWWGPSPWRAETKYMDFREGGYWIYAMVGPENERHWSRADFVRIIPGQYFCGYDGFCDEEGNLMPSMPRNKWENTFTDQGDTTLVHVLLTFDTLEDLEKILAMGFREGFTAGLENLDRYLAAHFYLRRQNKTNKKARVTTYLNFPGRTEEAFTFYKKVFKSEFINGIKRFEDLPADSSRPPLQESLKKMVLHVELPISRGAYPDGYRCSGGDGL